MKAYGARNKVELPRKQYDFCAGKKIVNAAFVFAKIVTDF